MKKLTYYFLGLITAVSFTAYAAKNSDLIHIFGKTGTDTELRLSGGDGVIKYDNTANKLQFSNNGGADLKDLGTGSGGSGGVNVLSDDNADFESGSPPSSWTASGGSFTSQAGSPLFGSQSGQWDSDGSSQTLTSAAKNMASFIGLQGNECIARIFYSYEVGSTGDYKLQAHDGTNVLTEVDLAATAGSAKEAFAAFTCPSSGTIALRVQSQVANADPITVDEAHLGSNIKGVQVASTDLIADAHYPATASCTWSVTSASFADFATTVACPAIVVNSSEYTIDTADNDLPDLAFSSLPPGKYEVLVEATFGSATAGSVNTIRLSDGTTDGQGCSMQGDASGEKDSVSCSMAVTYTDTGARTFKVQGRTSSGSITLYSEGNGQSLKWRVKRYPLSSEKALSLNSQEGVWSGYHDNTCSWSRTNAAFGDPAADATCALVESINGNFGSVSTSGSVLPKITFTPKSNGKIFVKATVQLENATANANVSARLVDGAELLDEANCRSNDTSQRCAVTLSGFVEVNSIASKTLAIQTASSAGAVSISPGGAVAGVIHWSLFNLSVLRSAVIPDAVTTPSAGSGVKLVSAYVYYSAGVPSETNEYGDWIDTVSDDGVGISTVNFNAGFFSQKPVCQVTGVDNAFYQCRVASDPSTSAVTVRCGTGSGSPETDPADANEGYSISCHGR